MLIILERIKKCLLCIEQFVVYKIHSAAILSVMSFVKNTRSHKEKTVKKTYFTSSMPELRKRRRRQRGGDACDA